MKHYIQSDNQSLKDGSFSGKPPQVSFSLLEWLKKNLFSSPFQVFLTILSLALMVYILIPLIQWGIFEAVWKGDNREACTTIAQGGVQANNWSGACWAFIKANFSQFIYGFYPEEQRWRVGLSFIITAIVVIPLLIPTIPFKILNFCLVLFAVPMITGILLVGGIFDLPFIDTSLWGGLMVTLIIAYFSIVVALPLGVLLALGRRSNMLIMRSVCIAFIELLRGIPLVALLFIASVLLPLFLPQGLTFDKFLRAIMAVALFTSVYIAEVVRGGLQAIPKRQYDAAYSLGFSFSYTLSFIILPQALRLVIPALVNVAIGMFKETSLVYIISMYDLLGIIRAASMQTNWIAPQTPATGLIFAAMVFWCLCFILSMYARFLENYSKDKILT